MFNVVKRPYLTDRNFRYSNGRVFSVKKITQLKELQLVHFSRYFVQITFHVRYKSFITAVNISCCMKRGMDNTVRYSIMASSREKWSLQFAVLERNILKPCKTFSPPARDSFEQHCDEWIGGIRWRYWSICGRFKDTCVALIVCINLCQTARGLWRLFSIIQHSKFTALFLVCFVVSFYVVTCSWNTWNGSA
jgi:hypothetical protein